MNWTMEQLCDFATTFTFRGGIQLIRGPKREGEWFFQRPGGYLLHKRDGWQLFQNITDRNFLFPTVEAAVEFLQQVEPEALS